MKFDLLKLSAMSVYSCRYLLPLPLSLINVDVESGCPVPVFTNEHAGYYWSITISIRYRHDRYLPAEIQCVNLRVKGFTRIVGSPKL